LALDFTKDGTNYLHLGNGAISPLLAGCSKFAVSALIHPDALTNSGATNNYVIRWNIASGTTLGGGINIDTSGSASGVIRASARSNSGDGLQFRQGSGSVGTGSWKHVGMVADLPNDLIYTVLNGSVEGSTAVAFGGTTYTNAGGQSVTDRIGSNTGVPPGTAEQFDGRIAEVAVWALGSGDALLTAEEWAALAGFVSPALIRPHLLVYHNDLNRRTSDRVAGVAGTVSGSLSYADHPRILVPRPAWINLVAASGGTTVPIGGASFAMTGRQLVANARTALPVSAGAFGLTGRALTPLTPTQVQLAAASFAMAGRQVVANARQDIAVAAASFGLTGRDVVASAATIVQLAATSFAMTGRQLVANARQNVAVAAASFGLTARSVVANARHTVAASAASFGLTGRPVTPVQGNFVPIGAASFGFTGRSVGATAPRSVSSGPCRAPASRPSADLPLRPSLYDPPGSV
jgi:hypothetical protein